MAKILILDRDTVLSAVLADRLESIGHRVDCFTDPLRLLEYSSHKGADLLVLDVDWEGMPPNELVRSLRHQELFQTSTILAHSADSTPARRLAALRAGVDDILPSDIEIDELVLRVQRLLGSRTGQLPLLQGSLVNHQLIEFLQYVRHSGRSGTLRVQSRQGSGNAVLQQGEVVKAAWDNLRGESALVAMLGLSSGSFRMETVIDQPGAERRSVLDLQGILLRAAWLEDQLNRWRPALPPSSARLTVTSNPMPDFAEELTELPIDEVLQRARSADGIRLFDLRTAGLAAPQEIELVVAMLLHGKVLSMADAIDDDVSTLELQVSDKLRWSVEALMERARGQAMTTQTYSLLILFEESCHPSLQALLALHRHREIQPLLRQLERRRGGSLVYPTDLGRLALHVQQLNAESLVRVAPILPACSGIFVWLGETVDEAQLTALAAKLDGLEAWIDVVIAAEGGAAMQLGELLAESRDSWRFSRYRPSNVGGILRYFPGPES